MLLVQLGPDSNRHELLTVSLLAEDLHLVLASHVLIETLLGGFSIDSIGGSLHFALPLW